ncbi:MAG: valine--tRNA ligase, partial [Myxococcota bacterium]|nr:valine--tRNA ligase [Myxococcota bacterium]
INWSPGLQTSLSDLEVDHKDVQGHLWHIIYPVSQSDETLMVATTRPETMLGDTAVAVHPEDERYKHLIGKTIDLPLSDRQIPIIGDAELVDLEFGTGAVKVTPAHDFNDFATGKRHDLEIINILDESACILLDGPYQGMAALDARKQIVADLDKANLLDKVEPHGHSVGHCQRSGCVVEPRLSLQWFVNTKPLAAKAIEATRSGATQIVPKRFEATWYHWMENIQDWCISRQLWWGHQIPAWYGPDGTCFVAKNAEEAHAKAMAAGLPEDVVLTQDDDVLDTWFSSGLWPMGTLGWPDDDDDLKTFYPTDVLETGHDILFFWVARMMMMGIHFTGKPPFHTIFLHGMIRDEHGHKMSKTRENVIDPLHIVHGSSADDVSGQFKKQYPDGLPPLGADALRFTLAAMSANGGDIKLSIDRILGYRALANKVWNAARFALMRLEGNTPPPLEDISADLIDADHFILSRLALAAQEADNALEHYRVADAANIVYSFIWNEFCDWYIELVKPRLNENSPSGTASQACLIFVLDKALKLLSPFMPYVTEEIWQKIPASKSTTSIMTAPWPKDLGAYRNEALENKYRLMQQAVTGLRTIRAESNVSPGKEISAQLFTEDESVLAALEEYKDEIKHLAKVLDLDIVLGKETPAQQCSLKVLNQMTVVVPLAGLIDIDAEIARLQKSLEKTKEECERIQKKLSNASFVERAPKDIVEREKQRLAELSLKEEKLGDNIKALKV